MMHGYEKGSNQNQKMRKNNLWMWAAVLMCGLGMTLTSCSDKDDEIDNSDKNSGTSEYVIEIGPGLTMNENQFVTKVPATTDCDPNVIAALQAIEKVTDVKAFKLVNLYNYETDKTFTKTAYFFNFKQDIDHNNPSKGWFKQQCVLTVAGKDRPTVLQTEGYALSPAGMDNNRNRLDSIQEPTLVQYLNANCLQVEHRYQGWSLPEGWTNKWNYLNAKQQSDDLHAIVEAVKGSGIISKSSKWLATGVSKNGETAAYYAYHHPNDLDAYVPFCAPFLRSLSDQHSGTYIINKEALGDRLDAVKAAFRSYFGNKTLQSQVIAVLKQKKPDLAESFDNDNEIRLYLFREMYSNHFQKMSYVHYKKWMPLLPKEGDSAEKYYNYIMANAHTKYDNETQEEYDQRQDNYEDLENDDNDDRRKPFAFTRAAETKRFDPFTVQLCIELGDTADDYSWVKDLLTTEELNELPQVLNPDEFGVTYDGGAFMKEFLSGMKQSDCHMFFVYGKQDPWTGSRIPDDCLGKNSKILYIADGTHDDSIDKWTDSERAQLRQWLQGLGFL